MSDFHETLERRSAGEYLRIYKTEFDTYVYFQRKNMADFHILQGKLEPMSLNKLILCSKTVMAVVVRQENIKLDDTSTENGTSTKHQ